MSELISIAISNLEATAKLAPGYSAALMNLAGELAAIADGEETEHGGCEWATAAAAALLNGVGKHDSTVNQRH